MGLESKSIESLIHSLDKNIEEVNDIHKKAIEQTLIAKDIGSKTENIENLRFIINDLTNALELWYEKDGKLFSELTELLRNLREFPWQEKHGECSIS